MFSKKEIAIVSNLRFIRRTNFILGSVEYEKSFIISLNSQYMDTLGQTSGHSVS